MMPAGKRPPGSDISRAAISVGASRVRTRRRRVRGLLVVTAMALFDPALGAFAAVAPDGPDTARAPEVAREALAAEEWQAIRKTIVDQLAALREGDASRAFSFASAGIRQQFGDADTFLSMVRGSYAALLDARYTEFLEGAVIDGHTIQPLRLVLQDETVLVALYEMQRDERVGWRIAGCVIAPSTVRSI